MLVPRLVAPGEEAAAAAGRLVEAVLGSRMQARLGELVDVLAPDVLLLVVDSPGPAVDPGDGDGDGRAPAGAATVAVRGDRAELLALAVDPARRRAGVGAALVDAAAEVARHAGAAVLWLVTTNDNLAALALYQRCGFRLVELRPGAVDDARRRLKPAIPLVGDHGIPLRDELVLERPLA